MERCCTPAEQSRRLEIAGTYTPPLINLYITGLEQDVFRTRTCFPAPLFLDQVGIARRSTETISGPIHGRSRQGCHPVAFREIFNPRHLARRRSAPHMSTVYGAVEGVDARTGSADASTFTTATSACTAVEIKTHIIFSTFCFIFILPTHSPLYIFTHLFFFKKKR